MNEEAVGRALDEKKKAPSSHRKDNDPILVTLHHLFRRISHALHQESILDMTSLPQLTQEDLVNAYHSISALSQ